VVEHKSHYVLSARMAATLLAAYRPTAMPKVPKGMLSRLQPLPRLDPSPMEAGGESCFTIGSEQRVLAESARDGRTA